MLAAVQKKKMKRTMPIINFSWMSRSIEGNQLKMMLCLKIMYLACKSTYNAWNYV